MAELNHHALSEHGGLVLNSFLCPTALGFRKD
jgi:hypothetical protein